MLYKMYSISIRYEIFLLKQTNKTLNPNQLVDLTASEMSEIKEKAKHHEKAVSLRIWGIIQDKRLTYFNK